MTEEEKNEISYIEVVDIRDSLEEMSDERFKSLTHSTMLKTDFLRALNTVAFKVYKEQEKESAKREEEEKVKQEEMENCKSFKALSFIEKLFTRVVLPLIVLALIGVIVYVLSTYIKTQERINNGTAQYYINESIITAAKSKGLATASFQVSNRDYLQEKAFNKNKLSEDKYIFCLSLKPAGEGALESKRDSHYVAVFESDKNPKEDYLPGDTIEGIFDLDDLISEWEVKVVPSTEYIFREEK